MNRNTNYVLIFISNIIEETDTFSVNNENFCNHPKIGLNSEACVSTCIFNWHNNNY